MIFSNLVYFELAIFETNIVFSNYNITKTKIKMLYYYINC